MSQFDGLRTVDFMFTFMDYQLLISGLSQHIHKAGSDTHLTGVLWIRRVQTVSRANENIYTKPCLV